MLQIRKPVTSLVIVLVIFVTSSLFFTSCNNNTLPPGATVIPATPDTSALANINHFIPESQIKQYREAFRTDNDSLKIKFPALLIPDAEAFNKPAVLEILKDPRCVGIRIYHGVKKGSKNEIRVIIVGVDSQGNDILISGGSAVATDIVQTKGGLETGQCPSCVPAQ
jgi:hypothetical protein